MGKTALKTKIATVWNTPFLRNILLVLLLAAGVAPLYGVFAIQPQYTALLMKITQDDADRAAGYLAHAVLKDGAPVAPDRLGPEREENIERARRSLRLEKVKIFSQTGIVAYSTDAKDLGTRNEHDYFWNVVAKGQVFTKVVRKESPTVEGRTATRDVVETYQPVMDKGVFLGAFELYYDITERLDAIDLLRRNVIVQTLIVTMALVVAMAFVLYRATNAIQQRDRAQLSLTSSEQRFRNMTASAQDGIIEVDRRGLVSFWNQAAERIFGYTEDEVLGKPIQGFVAPQRFQAAFDKDFSRLQETGHGSLIGRTSEISGVRKSGEEFPLEASVAAVPETGGYRAIGILRDITRRRQAEQGLKLGSSVIDHASQGIMVTDADGSICMVNPAFSRLTGYSQAEVVGANPRILQSGRHDKKFYAGLWSGLLGSGEWQGEIWNRRKDGEIYPAWISLNAIRDPAGHITNFVGPFSDISELKEDAEGLKRLVFYDPLTALPNTMLFRERLDLSLKVARRSSSKQTAVLFLDLDKFKLINDSYGHTTGDILLQEVAKRLSAVIRETDTVARLGGDEFAIVLDDVPDATVPIRIAQTIIAAIDQPFQIGANECHVGVSVGIVIAPDHAQEASSLIQLADAAMYRAKRNGGNCFHRHTI